MSGNGRTKQYILPLQIGARFDEDRVLTDGGREKQPLLPVAGRSTLTTIAFAVAYFLSYYRAPTPSFFYGSSSRNNGCVASSRKWDEGDIHSQT